MEVQFILVLLSSALLVQFSDSALVDTIPVNEAIKDGNTVVSLGGVFELGFFIPGKSKNRYLGIWYKKISVCTPVWVANRETPIADNSGMFKVISDGQLVVMTGENSIIWSSNSTSLTINPVARLLDNGNLVLWDYSSTNQNLIWQSFDYPGDTFLAGMKFGKDLRTGLEWPITSWKSPDDPSQGQYVTWVDTNGYPQMFGRKDNILRWRIGPWNGIGFSGLPGDTPNPIYGMDFVVNQEEIFHRYELKTSVIQRFQLTWDGKILQTHWIERLQQWVVYTDLGVDSFNSYGVCGPYGSNNINRRPLCSCLRGFEPRLPNEWEASDWSGGCQRSMPLDCASGDGFWKISGVISECEMACRRKCSCTAFANLDIRGSGCLLWFGGEYDADLI